MLIEFSVSNFLSFRDKQTFSMVAAPRLRKKGNTFKAPVVGERFPDLLKVAAIYGPNASGKSNLTTAMRVFGDLIRRATSEDNDGLPVKPFRFDPALRDTPSEFEVHFIQNQLRYEFNLAATSERITLERLVSYPKGKETLLYERRHTKQGDEYIIGTNLEGGKEIHEVWKKVTAPKRLFISQAVSNSNESLTQLRDPHAWLQHGLGIIHKNLGGLARSAQVLVQHEHVSKQITEFLQEIDIPISGIRVTAKDGSDAVNFAERMENLKDGDTKLTHTTALGSAEFEFNEESDGTKNLMGFWLPWFLLQTGASLGESNIHTLVCDELDSSLHPLIVQSLVAKQLNSETPSQLIFTTHDTHLMDSKLLRRDQFWLTERDMNGATHLRCIHDFEGREGDDIEKRYYEGQYRSLPFVSRS